MWNEMQLERNTMLARQTLHNPCQPPLGPERESGLDGTMIGAGELEAYSVTPGIACVYNIANDEPGLIKREGPRLARIDYSKGSTRAAREIIPSWSWMAYDGAIRYMDIPPGAEWKAWYANVTSPWERVHDYNGRQPFELRVLARNIVDFAAGDRVFLDEPHSAAGHDFKCVVVGSRRAPIPMRAEEYYSLIVTLLDGEENFCQRARVLDRRHIDWDTPAVALRVR
ncbi:putative Heterokaryon incompatibility domain-containing protein [Seiridium unicorne]|uniref:Heterokaryon incompatibility domain-containing protein n=1 Tax=Seiridium unicorne TaxID=138068 RepID=A0ABR2VEL8_9PEZI